MSRVADRIARGHDTRGEISSSKFPTVAIVAILRTPAAATHSLSPPPSLSLPFSLCIHKADVLCSFDGAASTPPPPATLSSCSHSLRLSLCRKFTVGKFGILSQLRRASATPLFSLSLSHLSTRIGAPYVRASALFPYGEHTRRN